MTYALCFETRDGITYYRNKRGKWSHSLQAHAGVADVLTFETQEAAQTYIDTQLTKPSSARVVPW